MNSRHLDWGALTLGLPLCWPPVVNAQRPTQIQPIFVMVDREQAEWPTRNGVVRWLLSNAS